MLNSLKSIPFGVWAGMVIFLLAAWAKDILGLILGVILVVVTLVTVSRRDARELPTDPEDLDPKFKDL